MINVNDIKVGDTFEEVIVDNLTRTQIVQYAGVSGDYNPLHTDEIFTTQVAGYPSVFAHGMLTMGMTGKMLTNLVGDDNLKNFGVRFTSQVWPGDTLTTKAEITSIEKDSDNVLVNFELVTENQNNIPVVTGSATALI
tara:strand:+ start:4450 stop:4863 length:414 start_codon:yes stop_codon:yes gene_type:complete